MARIAGVVMNENDCIVVKADGSAFMLTGGLAEGDIGWAEIPPVPRTEAAGRRDMRDMFADTGGSDGQG